MFRKFVFIGVYYYSGAAITRIGVTKT